MAQHIADRINASGPKRILALDGGGARGIVTIAYLEKLEELLRQRSGRGADFRLSDYFDLVGGTSVGSILATLIALGYPVADIKKLFQEWCPAIFHRSWFGVPGFSPRFSSRQLKRRSRLLLKDLSLDRPEFKTGLAIITKRIDTGSPWVLTNSPNAKFWNDPEDKSYIGNRHFRIADLIRASAAAPYYFAPKRIPIVGKDRRPKEKPGLFVDGGVSPHNNPALKLFMLAGIKRYGFGWEPGADKLLIVSVGTGSFRVRMQPGFVTRNVSALFAANALRGMISDADVHALTLLQWLAAPKRRIEINSELEDMEGELLGLPDQNGATKPMLSFIRYDSRIEAPWLAQHCAADFPTAFTSDMITSLQQLDRPDLIDDLYKIGAAGARFQVTPDDFPPAFDPVAP